MLEFCFTYLHLSMEGRLSQFRIHSTSSRGMSWVKALLTVARLLGSSSGVSKPSLNRYYWIALSSNIFSAHLPWFWCTTDCMLDRILAFSSVPCSLETLGASSGRGLHRPPRVLKLWPSENTDDPSACVAMRNALLG